MTLTEILSTIFLKYPHSYTDDAVVSIINRTQAELFRTLYKPESATPFDIYADEPYYATDFSPDKSSKSSSMGVNTGEITSERSRSVISIIFWTIMRLDFIPRPPRTSTAA